MLVLLVVKTQIPSPCLSFQIHSSMVGLENLISVQTGSKAWPRKPPLIQQSSKKYFSNTAVINIFSHYLQCSVSWSSNLTAEGHSTEIGEAGYQHITNNSRHEQGSPGGALQPWNLYAQFQLHEKIKPTQKLWGGKVGREAQLLMETREPERKLTGSTVYSP